MLIGDKASQMWQRRRIGGRRKDRLEDAVQVLIRTCAVHVEGSCPYFNTLLASLIGISTTRASTTEVSSNSQLKV